MERLGHASPRAALIYQHATKDRDRAIAHAVDALAHEHKAKTDRRDDDDLPLAGAPSGT
ncbi:hypothetical protein [Jiangella aurantiaca]|uniref:hypothetical protein n=1 Tax=Jiangella aurantiaca TaxID=2530373 RepID=UPI00193D48F3|nr:hypothetical protein [Jiangella aurantiaca]